MTFLNKKSTNPYLTKKYKPTAHQRTCVVAEIPFILIDRIMEQKKLNILRQVVEEGFGRTNLHIIDQCINDNCIEHQFNMKGGKEGLKKAILSLDKAFSNRFYQLMNHVIHENIVWTHYRFNGKHTGPFIGHEPTGKEFSIDVIDIARIENDQIVEHWGIPDRFALMVQLGIFQLANQITK